MRHDITSKRQSLLGLIGCLSGAFVHGCTGLVDYPAPSERQGTGGSGGSGWPAPSDEPPSSAGTATAPGQDPIGDPLPDCDAVQPEALAILQTNCASCHGPGTNTAGFDTVLDPAALESSGKIVPGDALGSPLYQKIASDQMPPAAQQQRPSDHDVAVIYQWIDACLAEAPIPDGQDPEPGDPSYIEIDTMLGWMTRDLSGFDLDDRRFLRYFSLVHLHNAGGGGAELDVYRYALTKAVNALSLGTQIVNPVPIDSYATLYRIDLRDYEWEATATRADKWEELVASNPYATERLEDEAEVLKIFTETDVPFQAADWFVNAGSQPPLYHTMLDIPQTLAELELQLGLDIEANVQGEEVWRAGFLNSGISFQNRVIERHDIPVASTRSLWISYDFAGDGGFENIFANPLDFQPDGSEVIFSLPNGLHAYMVVNAAGGRLDAAPDEIVVDPLQQDRDVRNGISCISCHANGTKPKDDELRAYVESSADFDFDTKQRVAALHPEKTDFQTLIEQDESVFKAAIERLEPPPDMPAEPVITVFNEFDENVDLERAAAELGIYPAALLAELGGLNPELAPLAYTSIKRDVFRDAFAETVCLLNLGLTSDASCGTPEP